MKVFKTMRFRYRRRLMSKCFLKSESGFTFVELMISMLVASLTILLFIGSNVAIQRNSEVAFEKTLAMRDAHRAVEMIRQEANDGTFPADVITAYPDSGAIAGFNTLTDEVVTVSYADTLADPLDVTIDVAWTSGQGRSLTVSLRSLVTQR